MKIVVYVEGPSDKACLETLLRPLIAVKESGGTRIIFVPMTRGDRKKELLIKAPRKAAHAILNDPDIAVVILPDLYPPNKGFAHEDCAQMQAGVRNGFARAIGGAIDNRRIAARFHVFCMIHDLEVLLLAAEEALMADRNIPNVSWHKPVEKHNHGDPPKRVVTRLFENSRETYQGTVDGPRILAAADYRLVRDRCPDGFGRFVTFLESV